MTNCNKNMGSSNLRCKLEVGGNFLKDYAYPTPGMSKSLKLS